MTLHMHMHTHTWTVVVKVSAVLVPILLVMLTYWTFVNWQALRRFAAIEMSRVTWVTQMSCPRVDRIR